MSSVPPSREPAAGDSSRSPADADRARRAQTILYVVMFVFIFSPLVVWWLKK
jgi:uncharacterized Tic20 family protein